MSRGGTVCLNTPTLNSENPLHVPGYKNWRQGKEEKKNKGWQRPKKGQWPRQFAPHAAPQNDRRSVFLHANEENHSDFFDLRYIDLKQAARTKGHISFYSTISI